jgi:hypothetical protein
VLRHLLHFWSADDIKKRPRRSNALSQPLLVVTGFAPIRNALEYWERSGRLPIPGEDLDRHYEYSVNGLSGSYQASDVRDGKGAMDPDPPRLEGISTWRLLDQSESGFRLAAPIQEGATLPMGTLVALAISSEDWVIALIRRIRKVSSTQAEYGVERLGSHARPITLRATTQEWLTRPANARRDRDLGPPMRGLLLGSGNREADFREQALILPAEGFIPKAMRWMCAADRSSVVRLSIALAGGPEWTWTGFDEIGTVAPTS